MYKQQICVQFEILLSRPKSFGPVQNSFRPIEGRGIIELFPIYFENEKIKYVYLVNKDNFFNNINGILETWKYPLGIRIWILNFGGL